MSRQWEPRTRGGYWVRGIEEIDREAEFHDLHGQVGNYSNEPPSEDPADWHWETWRSDGRYMVGKESVFDLIEVQDGN
jgi:hypothetical protein